jgi:phospholipid/cholesterol/gamma-HCH transport system ATP-binding protein
VAYGPLRALDDISFEISSGSRVLVLGPAGSGKTTLIKVIAGLYRATSGKLLWGESDVASLSRTERQAGQAKLGLVFQSDALFDSLNVLDNILLPLLRRGVSQDAARERALETLRAVGLEKAVDVRPERLSGGMRKRVGLARAIVSQPDVLLADDPLAGLDPATSRQVCELLAKVSQDKTLVLSAAEPPPGLSFPRWLFLERGKVLHDGGPRPELLDVSEPQAGLSAR